MKFVSGALALALAAFSAETALGQAVSLNYDSLSSLEEPLAYEIGDVTFNLTGLTDGSLRFDLQDDGDVDPAFLGNFQISAATQLPNSWRIGVVYFGQYETDPGFIADLKPSNDHYTDNIAGQIGLVWGTFLGGNVGGIVRENTRRIRGAGNGILAFDDFYGGLGDLGGAYVGRYGPVVLSGAVGEDGNVDVGFTWSRPLGTKDYRFSLRYSSSRFQAADGPVFGSDGIGAVGEIVYASTLFDIGFGYENLSEPGLDIDRWYLSGGARWKKGALSLSLEGHFGKIEGEDEISFAFGGRYDIARGLSVNLGVNYADARFEADDILLVNKDEEAEALLSLRYSF